MMQKSTRTTPYFHTTRISAMMPSHANLAFFRWVLGIAVRQEAGTILFCSIPLYLFCESTAFFIHHSLHTNLDRDTIMPVQDDIVDPVILKMLGNRVFATGLPREDREDILRSSMDWFTNPPPWTDPQHPEFCLQAAWNWLVEQLPTTGDASRDGLSHESSDDASDDESSDDASSDDDSSDDDGSDAGFTGSAGHGKTTECLLFNDEHDPVERLLREVSLRLSKIHLIQGIAGADTTAAADAGSPKDDGSTGIADNTGTAANTGFPYDGSIFERLPATTHVFNSDDDFHQLHLHLNELSDFAIEEGLARDTSHEAEVLRTRVPGLPLFGDLLTWRGFYNVECQSLQAKVTLFERIALRILELESWIQRHASVGHKDPLGIPLFSRPDDARLQLLRDAGFLFLPLLVMAYQGSSTRVGRVNPHINTGTSTAANASISDRIADLRFLLGDNTKLDQLNLHMERVTSWAIEAGFATDTSSAVERLRNNAAGFSMFGDFADWENRGNDEWKPWYAFVQLFERLAVHILELENYINPHTAIEIQHINFRLQNAYISPTDADRIHSLHRSGFRYIPIFILFCQGAGTRAGQQNANAGPSDTELPRHEDHMANIADALLGRGTQPFLDDVVMQRAHDAGW
jgi:hypothetical protein